MKINGFKYLIYLQSFHNKKTFSIRALSKIEYKIMNAPLFKTI